jgi:arylsulfatase A-like enzyme
VPLLVTGPGLARGVRVPQPVSMLDVLPTLLELCGLPPAEASQGRSLAPALRGGALSPVPVLFDEVRVDEASGALVGNIEVIDGRWGASLEVGPLPPGADPALGRHTVPAGGRWGAVHPWFPQAPRLALYDLAADPFATRAVNDDHPELVERYRRLLAERWEAHQALAQRFTAAGGAALTPDQLESLRALGYIR